jgi:hypothetical protein
MTRSSRFILPFALVALAASLAVGVPRAAATDPFPTTGVVTLSSDHFVLHYWRDGSCPSAAITQEHAGEVRGMAERAYAFYSAMGYTAPASATDVSADDFTIGCFAFGIPPGATPAPLDRWDAILGTELHLSSATGLGYHVIAHEVFHLFEETAAPSGLDPWLEEGLAEWAAVRADAAVGGLELSPDRTMDCVGSECGDSEFDKNGYPGWVFFEYLAESSGDAKIKSVLDRLLRIRPGAAQRCSPSVVQPLGPALGSSS